MTTFLRLLSDSDKAEALAESCARVRQGASDPRLFEVAPEAFDAVPGKPFAYWVSDTVRRRFIALPPLHNRERAVWSTNPLNEDFRYARVWWEVSLCQLGSSWVPWAKGGAFSPFYYDVHTTISWSQERNSYGSFIGTDNRPLTRPASVQYFFRPGITWPRRTQGGLSLRAMPAGCIFADKGPAAFVANDDPEELLALLALTNSRAFALLVSLQMAFGSYEVGVIQKTPIPLLTADHRSQLARLARRAWSLKRTLDTVNETSHAFLLPAALCAKLGDYDPPAIDAELARIQAEIDQIAFDLYGFSSADRVAAEADEPADPSTDSTDPDEDEDADASTATHHSPLTTHHFLSWAVGVAFGRFDWRLATGEREPPPEPDPFDPLPARSPGMLPEGAAPFHVHPGVLVDDPGHPHDLARLVETVLERVDMPVPSDVRRWLQREFFPFHLQRYSKSRRKAPIYWPLATQSGRYTLWIYYPSLSSQTLYTAINDDLEPKLKHIEDDLTALRERGTARTREDEKAFEALQGFALELTELRDTLLKIAPTYRPNHDDGVQISAAPLWPLFRHKPWQKVLKDTWAKLAKGDYDWAHLAMNHWPERVREKCKTDKSLAIAHGLDSLYIEPPPQPKKARGRQATEGLDHNPGQWPTNRA